jgi:hypothetical protein
MDWRKRLKQWLDIVLGDAAQRAALGPRKPRRPKHRPEVAPAPPPEIDFPPAPPTLASQQAQIDAYLAELSRAITRANPPATPTILITGAMRCGKTRVAKEICAHKGMIHIPSDKLRNAVYLGAEGALRVRLVHYVYKRLILMHPTGLVIEGTVFLDNDINLTRWAKARGVKTFAIGYSHRNVARKAHSLITFRKKHKCWTSDLYTDAELHNVARKIILNSRQIKQRARSEGFRYLDLDSTKFASQMQDAVRTILRDMDVKRQRDRSPPPALVE